MESFKSGFEPPGDFPFEDFSQNLSRTSSDGTISNTPKGDRERDGAPAPRSDPKHPMSRTKNKLWLFGKKPKVQGVRGACCGLKSGTDGAFLFTLAQVLEKLLRVGGKKYLF